MTNEALCALLKDMTLDEKIGQLTLLQTSSCLDGNPTPFGPLLTMNVTPEQMSLCGVFGCNVAPEPVAYAKIIRTMTENHPPPYTAPYDT